jgi:hypothetical protein
MHYSLKEPLDGTIDAQVTFMKQHFSQLPIFRDDEQRMQDIKKQKLCEEGIKDGRRTSQ